MLLFPDDVDVTAAVGATAVDDVVVGLVLLEEVVVVVVEVDLEHGWKVMVINTGGGLLGI